VITGVFPAGSVLFAWYSIGLLAGMAAFFALFGKLNGKKKLAAMMAGEPDLVSGRAAAGRPGGTGPDGAQTDAPDREKPAAAPVTWDPPKA
jgi:hypothetical protein